MPRYAPCSVDSILLVVLVDCAGWLGWVGWAVWAGPDWVVLVCRTKGIDLDVDITVTDGPDGLGGGFVPVGFYDAKFVSFAEAGILTPQPCAYSCLVVTDEWPSGDAAARKEASVQLAAAIDLADANAIVGAAVRATVAAVRVPSGRQSQTVLALAFSRDVAGAAMAARCVAAPAGEKLLDFGLYGFIDGRKDERIVEVPGRSRVLVS